MTSFRYVICDVFTDRPLAGNQLAVFTDARAIPEDVLQPLAREMAFSETVFVYPAEGAGHAKLRIFTPASELRFAGHPVLGSAFVLAGPMQLEEIRLETGAGVIPVRLEREGAKIVFGRMQQPVPTVEPSPVDDAKLLDALGVKESLVPIELYDNGMRNLYVVLRDEEAVATLMPDLYHLARLPGVVGINCTAGEGTRWKTRMFAPGDGVPEDPATGSAAGPLAVHLARHGLTPFGEELVISQGVELSRPSVLYATAWGTTDRIDRVEVAGAAVVLARGELRL